MASPKGGNGEYAFTRAAYDEQRDAEVRYATKWRTSLGTTFQKGVWSLRVEAEALTGECRGRVIASYEACWPNAQATTFAAFLYQCNHRVARMVESHWHDEQRKGAERVV